MVKNVLTRKNALIITTVVFNIEFARRRTVAQIKMNTYCFHKIDVSLITCVLETILE